MHDPCKIELFGGLCVRQGDQTITRFRSHKTGALLAYLALYRERAHPREVLIDLFWPDYEPEAARNYLSKALSSLRHQLEPPGVPVGAVLMADRFQVRLNPAATATDVAEFEVALHAAAQHAVGSAEDKDRAFLQRALRIYRGELLPGYYEEWVLTEQRRLAGLFFQAARRLTRLLEQAGDLDRAIEVARRAVGEDLLLEEAHGDLIRLLVAANQPSAALRQYRELERILREELDASPSSVTRELVAELLTERGRQSEGERGSRAKQTQKPAPDLPARNPNQKPATSFSVCRFSLPASSNARMQYSLNE